MLICKFNFHVCLLKEKERMIKKILIIQHRQLCHMEHYFSLH